MRISDWSSDVCSSDLHQDQAGVRLEHPLSAGHALELVAYGGTRETTQMLSIPVFVQADPRQGGGAIDLDREYGGADLRWRWATELGDRPFSLVAGLESRSAERRVGKEGVSKCIARWSPYP